MVTEEAKELEFDRISASPSPETARQDVDRGITECDHCRPAGVLVIEDERLMLKAMEQGLRRRGFVVWGALDGGEGVDLYRRFETQIDIVLSDVQMPVLDGPKTFDALRAIDPSVKLCFMTGDMRTSTHINLLNRGALRVFAKTLISVAEVAEELWKLATLPQAISVDTDLGAVDAVNTETKVPNQAEGSAGSGFFGWVVFSRLRSLVGIGSLRGKERSQPPAVMPPT